MTPKELIQYMDDPNKLNALTETEISEIVKKYPYFQTGHLLLVKNLQITQKPQFLRQLEKSSQNY